MPKIDANIVARNAMTGEALLDNLTISTAGNLSDLRVDVKGAGTIGDEALRLETAGSVALEDVLATDDDESGFDASTGKFVNMLDAGIVDPTKVTITALRNAVSIAGLMMTTNSLVTELSDDEDAEPILGAVS